MINTKAILFRENCASSLCKTWKVLSDTWLMVAHEHPLLQIELLKILSSVWYMEAIVPNLVKIGLYTESQSCPQTPDRRADEWVDRRSFTWCYALHCTDNITPYTSIIKHIRTARNTTDKCMFLSPFRVHQFIRLNIRAVGTTCQCPAVIR